MDCFDKVEELLLAEGYTKEEIPAIMVSLVEQGFDPTGVFLGGLANMLGFLPKKKDAKPKMADIRGGNAKVDGSGNPKVVKPTTTTPSWGPQSVRGTTQPNFITGSGKINQSIATGKGQPWMVKLDPVSGSKPQPPQTPKPPATPAGQMQIPGTSTRAQELRNITRNPNTGLPGGGNTGLSMSGGSNAMRNRSIFRAQSLRSAPSIPTGPVVKPPALTGALRNVRGNVATTALNMATAGALDKYVVEPAGKALGDALARGILDATGKGDRARQVNPGLYGKSGPNLTPEIVQGIRSREPRGQNLPPSAGDKKYNPDFGKPADPRTWKNTTKPAPEPVDTKPAPKPEPVRQTGDKAKDETTWRSANTRLSRVADMRKTGASREEINKVLYRKGTRAYGAK